MTERRALKRLVRERMARTGETYTTAHRHVVGPKHHRHRESALVRRMLSAAGIDLSEPMVCGLGGGIGFLYAVFEYKAVDHPLLTIVTQHHPTPWLDAVATHLGVAPARATSSSPGPALRKARTALETGRPVLVQVARGLLPWHDDVPAAEAADPHSLLLTGVEGDDLVVLDRDEHRIGQDELAVAWAAHRKGRFAVTTLPEARPEEVEGAADRAIATTYAHLTGPVLGHAFDVNFGLSGMARLRDELADTSTKRGWARRFGTDPAFEVARVRLAECLTWAHGSEGATRLVYADFLAETCRDEAASLARRAGAQWSGIADFAATANDPATAIPELADRVASVCDVEHALARALAAER
jgi:Butirosin biosynthesis protein H, N-terminal/Domain of unknown function (DUF4872)